MQHRLKTSKAKPSLLTREVISEMKCRPAQGLAEIKSKKTAYTSWQRQQARTAVANIRPLAEARRTERERKPL